MEDEANNARRGVHTTLVVHGDVAWLRRLRGLGLAGCDVRAPSGAEPPPGPLVILVAQGGAQGAPDLAACREAYPGATVVGVTTDHWLVASPTGMPVAPNLHLLRSDVSDADLREVLERLVPAASSAAPAAVSSREGGALRLEADWAHVIAHDLRTPLGINNGYAALLLDAPENRTPATREILQRMQENGEWMLRLVDGLLDVESLRHRGGRLEPRSTTLVDLLAGVARRMEQLADLHGVRVEWAPVPTADAFGLDATRVEQVLHNLVTNALRFSPAGGVVRMTAQAEDLEVRFDVSDQGVGMTPEEAEVAFNKFSSGARGRGLGLAIARAVVELHGGRIWVRTAPGEGSVFSFTVRATERTPAAAGRRAAR